MICRHCKEKIEKVGGGGITSNHWIGENHFLFCNDSQQLHEPEAQPDSQGLECSRCHRRLGQAASLTNAICPSCEAASPGTELCLKCHQPKEPSRPNSRYCRKCDGRCPSCGYNPCECPGTEMPPELPRIETGNVQFDNDWPGVFFRVDTALNVARQLRLDTENGKTVGFQRLRSLIEALEDCHAELDHAIQHVNRSSPAAPTLQGVPFEAALHNLVNELSGILGVGTEAELRQCFGNTNVEVLKLRLQEANTLLGVTRLKE